MWWWVPLFKDHEAEIRPRKALKCVVRRFHRAPVGGRVALYPEPGPNEVSLSHAA